MSRDERGVNVFFAGEDGRTRTYRTRGWPLEVLHEGLAAALISVTGPTGSTRTERSAQSKWAIAGRFLRFLVDVEPDIASWNEVRKAHIDGFEAHRTTKVGEATAITDVHGLHSLLRGLPESYGLQNSALQALRRRRSRAPHVGVGGYTQVDYEALVNAARHDARAIEKRLTEGEKLLATYQTDPRSLSDEHRSLAASIDAVVRGHDIQVGGVVVRRTKVRRQAALHVYLTYDDLAPLLVLLAATTALNAEAVKELPAVHAILDEGMVRTTVTKRRRGAGHWEEEMLWPSGAGSAELKKPGSVYQLVHRLTERGRREASSDKLWVVWVAGNRSDTQERGAPTFAWERSLAQAPLHLSRWARTHELASDGGPLQLSMNRVRTTAIAQRTKVFGGNIPSKLTSNSQDTLFKSYLAGDKQVREWASNQVGAALREAQQLIEGRAEAPIESGYLKCGDMDHGPFDDGCACTQTALACFRCPNAVVGESNLPRLLHLRSELVLKYDALEHEEFWRRYGVAWMAIQEAILPQFSADQVRSAEERQVTRLPLTLGELSWDS